MSEPTESKSIRRRLTSSIRKVIRTGSSKSKSSASTPAGEPSSTAVAASPAPAAGTSTSVTPTPKPEVAEKPEEKLRTKPHRAPKVPTARPPPLSAAERAQALFKKHGLDISTMDWPLSKEPQGERVQKDIRMRVHRTCHKCSTSYGPDKVCVNCGHGRCKNCPRHPTKKSKDKGKAKVGAKTTAPGYKKRKGDYMYGITIPGKKGGQDLVRKPVRQRVHRKCHRCQTDFAGEKICTNCKHPRCRRCPREPHKPDKVAAGHYDKFDPEGSEDEPIFPPPPRRTYKRTRRRVRWTCNECNTVFVEKTKECASCGQHRDDVGTRDPPKKTKTKYKPTEEELERLNARLMQTTLSA